jgi:hypothetical protein
MCGDVSQQDQTYQQQADFSKQMMTENATVFGKQQSILDNLNAGFSKIVAAGPSQKGFSADEQNILDTTATESVAANMSKASKALGEGQAAQGGGDTFIPSGVADQQREQLAATGAATDSTLHSQILEDNYAAGRTNYQNAVQGELGVSTQLNPVGYSDATTSANSGQANEANAIAASANSPFTAVMGALGGVAGAAATAYTGGAKPPCWIAAEIFGGWDEPRTVLVREWLVSDFSRGAIGRALVNLYRRFGERMAASVRKHNSLRWAFTRIFNLALKKAEAK